MGRVKKPRAVTEVAEAPPANDRPSKFRDEAEPIEDLMPGFETFVEELTDDLRFARQLAGLEAEQAALASAELDPALVAPLRVSNDDRIARQRSVYRLDLKFPDGPGGRMEMEERVASPPPAQPLRRAAPRRVSAEVVKAETALLNLERRRQDSLAHAETVWAQKRLALIQALPDDVHQALVAMKVLPVAVLDLEPIGG